MRRPRAGWWFGVAGAALALSAAGGGNARSATVADTGWWRMSTTAANLGAAGAGPTPGQLQVSSDPGGVSALAAVRVTLDAGEQPTRLVLTVASTTATPTLVACPAGSAWKREFGGVAANAPAAACNVAQTNVIMDAAHATVPLSAAFVRNGIIDVVLVPASTTGVPPTFTLVLEPVADGAAEVTRSAPTTAAPAGSAGSAGSSAPGGNATPTRSSPTTPTPANFPAIRSPDISTPAGPSSDGTAVSPYEVAAPLALVPALAPSRVGVRRGSPLDLARSTRVSTGRDGAQRLALLLFPLAGVGAIVAFNTDAGEPRALGPLLGRRARAAASTAGGVVATDETAGGIGRFRRLRSDPPPPIT